MPDDRPDRRALLGSVSAGLALTFARSSLGAQSAAKMWSERASLPWPVQEIYAAVSRGRIVVAGGLSGSLGQMRIEDRTAIYDPITDRWEEGPRLPEPRHHPMLVATEDGRTYALGGFTRSPGGEWSARTDVWVMENGRWIEAGRMPAPQCETVGASLGGRIHLVTGRAPVGSANADWGDHGDVAVHRTFEPASGRWNTARPAPAARNSAAGVVIGDALYVVGGRTVRGGNTGQLDRYDPLQDRWESLAPMPQGAGGLGAGAARGRLWVFGGEYFGALGAGVYAETWIYDPVADRWAEGPAMRTPRHGLAGASVNDAIFAVAGATISGAAGATGVVEALI
jgi:N-acetylneuraminic acid mutarotase